LLSTLPGGQLKENGNREGGAEKGKKDIKEA